VSSIINPVPDTPYLAKPKLSLGTGIELLLFYSKLYEQFGHFTCSLDFDILQKEAKLSFVLQKCIYQFEKFCFVLQIFL
jgi:hypothetical protein